MFGRNNRSGERKKKRGDAKQSAGREEAGVFMTQHKKRPVESAGGEDVLFLYISDRLFFPVLPTPPPPGKRFKRRLVELRPSFLLSPFLPFSSAPLSSGLCQKPFISSGHGSLPCGAPSAARSLEASRVGPSEVWALRFLTGADFSRAQGPTPAPAPRPHLCIFENSVGGPARAPFCSLGLQRERHIAIIQW